jgi:hypothetical protein
MRRHLLPSVPLLMPLARYSTVLQCCILCIHRLLSLAIVTWTSIGWQTFLTSLMSMHLSTTFHVFYVFHVHDFTCCVFVIHM